MSAAADPLAIATVLIGSATIWAAYGSVARGWISRGHGSWAGLSSAGTALTVVGLWAGVGADVTLILTAAIAIALTIAGRVLVR